MGFLDLISLDKVKFVISFAKLMVNLIFSRSDLIFLTFFFRYLSEKQLNLVVENLFKFIFLKNYKINLVK